MVHLDDLPAARRACSAILIPLLPVTLLLVTWLLPSHARTCSNAALCGDHIDAFFLPLIASSLTGAPAAGAATPVADMLATALPNRPVIIRPPPRTSPPAEPGMPGWRVRVEQQLVQPAARPARQGSRSTELSPRGLQGRPSGGGADDGGASAAKVHLGRHVGGRRPGRGAAWVALRAVSSDASCLWWSRPTRRLGTADENDSGAGPSSWSC